MLTDLVLSPLGAGVDELLDAARVADAGGFDTVWTYDHFSGLVQHARWSRDPFVTLGAIAATTSHVNLGVLVANAVNRHPAQLACAVNSLQSLALSRVRLGVGAGTASSSQWSAEASAIGRPVADPATRRAFLAETIDCLRALWRGEAFVGEHVTAAASIAVTDGADVPPIIVGASSQATIRIACEHADGVNLLPGDDLADRAAFAVEQRSSDTFEVSAFLALDPAHPLGGDPAPLEEIGVTRRTLYCGTPFPLDAIAGIGRRLSGH